MMKKRNTVDLPEELLVEILSRVPAISLLRFRSISKGWNSLINDGRFAKKHFANAPRTSLVIMFDLYRVYLLNLNLNGTPSAKVTSKFSIKDPLNNSSEEVHVRDVFQCDGLLLCATKDERLVVLNPCSGETKWIPPRNSYMRSDHYALGKSICHKYKILRMYRSSFRLETEYEVYDFASDSWRSVGNTADLYITWGRGCGVSLKGTTYWLACTQHEQYENCLANFDFSTETIQRQSIPCTNLHARVAALSVVREEKLCLLLTHPDIKTLDVWMATKSESTGVLTSWSKFLTANPTYEFSHRMSFLADEQNKVVVCCDDTKVPNNILHIVGEDRHIQVNHHGAESSYSCLLSYVPTLIQIPQVI